MLVVAAQVAFRTLHQDGRTGKARTASTLGAAKSAPPE
jgi:hypothetical protein